MGLTPDKHAQEKLMITIRNSINNKTMPLRRDAREAHGSLSACADQEVVGAGAREGGKEAVHNKWKQKDAPAEDL